MKTKIELVRRVPESYQFDEIAEGTLFLKVIESHEEIGFGFWLVHDVEEKLWYAIDEASGLCAARAKSRRECLDSFKRDSVKAHAAREGEEYEKALNRFESLHYRPIWDPKLESAEEFARRLTIAMEGKE